GFVPSFDDKPVLFGILTSHHQRAVIQFLKYKLFYQLWFVEAFCQIGAKWFEPGKHHPARIEIKGHPIHKVKLAVSPGLWVPGGGQIVEAKKIEQWQIPELLRRQVSFKRFSRIFVKNIEQIGRAHV